MIERVEVQRGMRSCWNWQTGMTKDHVSTDVRVQVSYSALVSGPFVRKYEGPTLCLYRKSRDDPTRFS